METDRYVSKTLKTASCEQFGLYGANGCVGAITTYRIFRLSDIRLMGMSDSTIPAQRVYAISDSAHFRCA